MESPLTPSRSARASGELQRTPRPKRTGHSPLPGPSRYRSASSFTYVPASPSADTSYSFNPFDEAFRRSDSIASTRELLHLHPSVSNRSTSQKTLLPLHLEQTQSKRKASDYWLRCSTDTATLAFVMAATGCLLGAIALGLAAHVASTAPTSADLRNKNSTLALAIAVAVSAALDAQRNVTVV